MSNITEKIEKIFKKAEHQEDALVGIYKLFVPKWNDIVSIDGWPSCGEIIYRFIAERFVAFDIERHPGILAGGLWFNKGFSCEKTLKPWEVSLDSCRVVTKEPSECFV